MWTRKKRTKLPKAGDPLLTLRGPCSPCKHSSHCYQWLGPSAEPRRMSLSGMHWCHTLCHQSSPLWRLKLKLSRSTADVHVINLERLARSQAKWQIARKLALGDQKDSQIYYCAQLVNKKLFQNSMLGCLLYASIWYCAVNNKSCVYFYW